MNSFSASARCQPIASVELRDERLRRMTKLSLAGFDATMLALLEREGSTFRGEFVGLSIGFDDGPRDQAAAEAWLLDATRRDLIRIDADEGLVSITLEGRNRLIELL